jgi:DNA-binding transcriptional ArsR family regulator
MEMTPELFDPVAERLRLLADATRLRILNVLREGERSVVEIVGAVGASQPNVSRHLALLLRAGIVARRPDGRQVYYRIVDPFVDRICEAICGSLRAHVDRQAQRLPGAAGTNGSARPSPVLTATSAPATTRATGSTTTSPDAATRRRRM